MLLHCSVAMAPFASGSMPISTHGWPGKRSSGKTLGSLWNSNSKVGGVEGVTFDDVGVEAVPKVQTRCALKCAIGNIL